MKQGTITEMYFDVIFDRGEKRTLYLTRFLHFCI